MTKEQISILIGEWSTKVRQMRLLRSIHAKGAAHGFAVCVVNLSQESGVDCPVDIVEFLKREGVL